MPHKVGLSASTYGNQTEKTSVLPGTLRGPPLYHVA